jgi:hypothetical protein
VSVSSVFTKHFWKSFSAVNNQADNGNSPSASVEDGGGLEGQTHPCSSHS